MVSRRGSAICHPSRGDACAGGDVAERGPCSSRLCCAMSFGPGRAARRPCCSTRLRDPMQPTHIEQFDASLTDALASDL